MTDTRPDGDSQTRGGDARRRRRRRLAVCAGSVALAALMGECAVRAFNLGPPQYEPYRIEGAGGVPYVFDSGGLPVYAPNVSFTARYDPAGDSRGYFGPDGRVTYQINEHRTRGASVSFEKPPGTYRVVCLGDSITFGEGVRYPDTYPAQLERLLSEAWPDRRVEVLNAGVQGYDVRQAMAFYAAYCARFRPDAVTLGFFMNDCMDFGETVRRHESLVRPPTLSWLGERSELWALLERGARARRVQAEYYESIRRSFRSPEWERCESLLRAMTDRSRSEGFRFIVLMFPLLDGLDGAYPFEDVHEQVASACRSAGCEYADLLDDLRGREAAALWVHPTDPHPNEVAHRLAAERLAAMLLASPAR